jgi:polyphosphate kinase 2 (PPK2 family)
LTRFKQRLDDPSRRWKFSGVDYKDRRSRVDSIQAFEDRLHKTSTHHASWYANRSTYQWFRDVAMSHVITTEFEELNNQLRKPTLNLADIRRQDHEATVLRPKGYKD